MYVCFFFFFSSRRRHTRSLCDWSSDVCSSDLVLTPLGLDVSKPLSLAEWQDIGRRIAAAMRSAAFVIGDWLVYGEGRDGGSEKGRVGEKGRSRWAPDH